MARKVAKAAAAPDVEVVSKPGIGLDEGIVLTTFFLLAAAVALVVIASKAYA
jgi:hypothetical protein